MLPLTNLYWENTQILHDAMECGHIIHPRGPSGHHEGLSAKGEEEQQPIACCHGREKPTAEPS